MNTKHSPTPWTASPADFGMVLDAQNKPVAGLDDSNAAHICLCVNAHEELKRVLSQLAYAAQKLQDSDLYYVVMTEVDEAMVLLENIDNPKDQG